MYNMKIYEVYYTVHLLNISMNSFPWPPHPRENWSYLPAVSAPELQRSMLMTFCSGIQKNSWMVYFDVYFMENPKMDKIWMMAGGSPILGNRHISRHISTVEDHSHWNSMCGPIIQFLLTEQRTVSIHHHPGRIKFFVHGWCLPSCRWIFFLADTQTNDCFKIKNQVLVSKHHCHHCETHDNHF